MRIQGSINISRLDVQRFIGELGKINHDMHLNISDILNSPSFISSNDNLKRLFESSAAYFDTKQRLKVVQRKIGVSQELVSLLWSEVDVAHSQALTWVVIFLVCFSCVIN